MNPESEGGELEEGGEGKTRRDDVLQLLESQRASVGEVKAEAEERELELIGKVKELEEEYERFLEELVTLVGYGEKGEKRMEVVERVAALIQAEINLKKQVNIVIQNLYNRVHQNSKKFLKSHGLLIYFLSTCI